MSTEMRSRTMPATRCKAFSVAGQAARPARVEDQRPQLFLRRGQASAAPSPTKPG